MYLVLSAAEKIPEAATEQEALEFVSARGRQIAVGDAQAPVALPKHHRERGAVGSDTRRSQDAASEYHSVFET